MRLSKGLARPLELYQDVTLDDVFDLAYHFEAQKGGWNVYPAQLKTGAFQYRQVSRTYPDDPGNTKLGKASDHPLVPPYALADHNQLFVPSADVIDTG